MEPLAFFDTNDAQYGVLVGVTAIILWKQEKGTRLVTAPGRLPSPFRFEMGFRVAS